MLRRTALLLLALGSAVASTAAQLPAPDARPDGRPDAKIDAAVAAAIRSWIEDFERGRLGPKGLLRRGDSLQPRYFAFARQAGLTADGDGDDERLTHQDLLQKLLFHAERIATPAQAEAVLDVAAAGLLKQLLDHRALELRELGHWTLMRMDNQGAWFVVLRAAAGERVPLIDDLRGVAAAEPDSDVGVGPARRVAALRLLGKRNLPVFRGTLEGALGDADPRVRLAAAEAIAPPWRFETMRRVAIALVREAHPVVSQALVRLLTAMLKASPERCEAADREHFVASALRQFGRCGWRTDMDLLDLVELFPRKSAIPFLITALDLEVHTPDALVAAINKRASPRLRDRAADLLRGMTGALIPNDDPAAWRAFWQQEHERIVVPDRLPSQRAEGTRAAFFGVPVTGGAVAFLIDTSGSMDEAPATGPTTGPRRRRSGESRLDAAKEQLLLAVQAMPAESTYVVLTFSEHAHAWNATPVRPSASTLRSVTELLSRFRPHGGTNLCEGLELALQWRGQAFGDHTATKIDELFVLSDGEPTAGEVRDTETLLTLVREANKYAKVRIHTVFTGNGNGSDLLRRLAEDSGGVFVQR